MMNKQKLYTLMGIALSFIIAVGGWALTSMLIGRKSDALLSATGITHINVQPVTSPTPANSDAPNIKDNPQEHPKLTEAEITKILLNWESPGREQPHEPMDGQLSMEQVIEASKADLSYFYEQGIIPMELLEYDKANAYLCEKQLSNKESEAPNPYYSYWRILFSSDNGYISLTINAVTGQIWGAEMGLTSSASVSYEIKAEKMLDIYTAYLGLSGSGSYTMNETTVSKSFADGTFHAVARSTSVREGINFRMAIYLSTQAAQEQTVE